MLKGVSGVWWLCAVLHLSACSLSLDTDALEARRCASDNDCPQGESCSGGFCTSQAPEPDGPATVCVDADTDGTQDPDRSSGCDFPVDCDDQDDRRSPFLPEFCDGVDNDCDNIVDETVLNVCGGCGDVPVEVCNDRDEDCDGTVDDGVSNLCGGCGALPEDFCDTTDNDCDGNIDEGLGDSCACEDGQNRPCPDEGACTQGQQSCDQGLWGVCEGAVLEGDEVCDGEDNDCDEAVDEGFDLMNDLSHCGGCKLACGNFQAQSRCVEGRCVLECQPGFVDLDQDARNGCETHCPTPSPGEICDDGLDNDCDGIIDGGCPQIAISGEYTFLNLFGRSSPELAPGLVKGAMALTDPGGPTATFTDLTIFAVDLEGGRRDFESTTNRRLQLDDQGQLVIPAPSGSDLIGGSYRGAMSPSRHFAALTEFNEDDNQVASIALLLRRLTPDTPASNHLIRGLYALPLALPRLALLNEPASESGLVLGLTMTPSTQSGEGRLSFLVGVGDFVEPENPFEYSVEPSGLLSMRPLPPSFDLFEGFVDTRGGLGMMTLADEEGRVEPGLALLIERRQQPPPMPDAGAWTLIGLQTALNADMGVLAYNAVLLPMRFSATEEPDQPSAVLSINEDAGTISIVGNGPNASLQLTLTTADNLNPPVLHLRGHLDASGEVMVLWEIDPDSGLQIRSSVFLAIKGTSGG